MGGGNFFRRLRFATVLFEQKYNSNNAYFRYCIFFSTEEEIWGLSFGKGQRITTNGTKRLAGNEPVKSKEGCPRGSSHVPGDDRKLGQMYGKILVQIPSDRGLRRRRPRFYIHSMVLLPMLLPRSPQEGRPFQIHILQRPGTFVHVAPATATCGGRRIQQQQYHRSEHPNAGPAIRILRIRHHGTEGQRRPPRHALVERFQKRKGRRCIR